MRNYPVGCIVTQSNLHLSQSFYDTPLQMIQSASCISTPRRECPRSNANLNNERGDTGLNVSRLVQRIAKRTEKDPIKWLPSVHSNMSCTPGPMRSGACTPFLLLTMCITNILTLKKSGILFRTVQCPRCTLRPDPCHHCQASNCTESLIWQASPDDAADATGVAAAGSSAQSRKPAQNITH